MTTAHLDRLEGRPSSRGALPALMLSVLMAAGCATSTPDPEPVDRAAPTRSQFQIGSLTPMVIYTEPGRAQSRVPAPPAEVWAVLPDVYDQLEIPLSHVDRTLLEVGNPGYSARRVEGSRMARYIDCGTDLRGQLANLYEITLSVFTRLQRGEEGSTVVVTTMDAYGSQRATSGNPVHCQSREVLERRVAELIAERFGGSAERPAPR